MIIQVQDARVADRSKIPAEADFKQWVWLAARDKTIKGKECAGITVRVVDSDEMQRLNREFRQMDKPTNVLSFTYDDHPEGYLGDVVICAPLVAREAREKSVPVAHHWAHLTVHGVLHLLGYDHETAQQAAEMELLETKLLATLNIADPYR